MELLLGQNPAQEMVLPKGGESLPTSVNEIKETNQGAHQHPHELSQPDLDSSPEGPFQGDSETDDRSRASEFLDVLHTVFLEQWISRDRVDKQHKFLKIPSTCQDKSGINVTFNILRFFIFSYNVKMGEYQTTNTDRIY